ncbi:MAG: hypothetical protein AAB510_01885 [Patescibacteria group bacterium]
MEIVKKSNWGFFARFLAYLFVSGFLFLFTSGGWSALFIVFYVWGSLAILAVVMFIISLIRSIRNVKSVIFNLTWLIPVFAFQFLGLILNRKDCGDSDGAFSFLTYMLNGFSSTGLCVRSNDYSLYFWFPVMILYLISVVIIFFFKTKPATD